MGRLPSEHETSETVDQEPIKVPPPAANLPQWISAVSSATVTLIALWALFFSSTSEALIKYLHTELATRNLHIASLELHEQKLQNAVEIKEGQLKSIEQKSSELDAKLSSLSSERSSLEGQVTALGKERDVLTVKVNQVRSMLSETQFDLVKEKIRAELAGHIIITDPFRTTNKPQTVEIWSRYLKYIQSTAEKLPLEEQSLASAVVKNFSEQCSKLSSVRVVIPPTDLPREDIEKYVSSDDQGKEKWLANRNRRTEQWQRGQEAALKQVLGAEDAIVKCLVSVSQ